MQTIDSKYGTQPVKPSAHRLNFFVAKIDENLMSLLSETTIFKFKQENLWEQKHSQHRISNMSSNEDIWKLALQSLFHLTSLFEKQIPISST